MRPLQPRESTDSRHDSLSESGTTVTRVSPNPRRLVGDADRERILAARSAHEDAYNEYQTAVIDAMLNGAGIRAISELTGLSTTTIQRWKTESQ